MAPAEGSREREEVKHLSAVVRDNLEMLSSFVVRHDYADRVREQVWLVHVAGSIPYRRLDSNPSF